MELLLIQNQQNGHGTSHEQDTCQGNHNGAVVTSLGQVKATGLHHSQWRFGIDTAVVLHHVDLLTVHGSGGSQQLVFQMLLGHIVEITVIVDNGSISGIVLNQAQHIRAIDAAGSIGILLVPSRVYPGKFYALPQSPQQYKQLLMLSGVDRYMQITRCFRDEDLRADRQPEFTQIDLEMSFVDQDDVIAVNEGFLQRVFKEVLDVDIQLPLPRMKWKDAMDKYGSDKPDLRFGYEIVDISDIAKDCSFKVFSGADATA